MFFPHQLKELPSPNGIEIIGRFTTPIKSFKAYRIPRRHNFTMNRSY